MPVDLAALFEDAERRMQKAVEALKQDLNSIRTGRASAALVEHLTVDYYGVPTPINQLATISVPEARLLVIQPWDRQLLKEISKAIQKSDLGINPTDDGQVIRLAIPPMSEERRQSLVKTAHKKVNEHKVAAQNIRRDGRNQVLAAEKKKEISEDELKRRQDQLDKLTNLYISKMDEIGKAKETEILEV
jgi:ribosome recycling factor